MPFRKGQEEDNPLDKNGVLALYWCKFGKAKLGLLECLSLWAVRTELFAL